MPRIFRLSERKRPVVKEQRVSEAIEQDERPALTTVSLRETHRRVSGAWHGLLFNIDLYAVAHVLLVSLQYMA